MTFPLVIRECQDIPLDKSVASKTVQFVVGPNFVAIGAKNNVFSVQFTDSTSDNILVKHNSPIIAYTVCQHTLVTVSRDGVVKVTQIRSKTIETLQIPRKKQKQNSEDEIPEENKKEEEGEDNMVLPPVVEVALGYRTWYLVIATKFKVIVFKKVQHSFQVIMYFWLEQRILQ